MVLYLWLLHIVSFFVAGKIKFTAINATEKTDKLILFVLIPCMIVDSIVFRYLLKWHFTGIYTEWAVYLLIFIFFDFYFISVKSNTLRKSGHRLRKIYYYGRKIYVFSAVVRFTLAGPLAILIGPAAPTIAFPKEDAYSTKTHDFVVFNELYLNGSKEYRLGCSFEIYKKVNFLYKKKIAQVEYCHDFSDERVKPITADSVIILDPSNKARITIKKNKDSYNVYGFHPSQHFSLLNIK